MNSSDYSSDDSEDEEVRRNIAAEAAEITQNLAPSKSIKYKNNLFCSDCAHLLRRFYNFRNKCRKAQKIMLDWKKLKIHKPPLETLCNRLPNAIGMWTAKGNKILSFDYSQDTAMNYPTLTYNANKTPSLVGNQNLLQFIVPVITPMSKFTNVTTINNNTEIKDPIKLEEDENYYTIFDIQNVKYQNVPNVNKEINSIKADTITFVETNEILTIKNKNKLMVKLEHDYVDLSDDEVQDDTITVAKDTVCKEEDFEEILKFDCLKAVNISSKDLDEIDDVLSDSDFEQENTKRSDIIIVDEDIDAIDLTDEIDDLSDFIDAASDDNNDNDNSTDVNDVVSVSDSKRLYNVTTKLTQFLNDLLDVCDIYQELLPLENIYDSNHVSLSKNLTPRGIDLIMTNLDIVITNNENTVNILKGDTMLLKESAKNIVLEIINEEDITSPEGSGIDKEFISQCLIEKEPMINVKTILRIFNNKKTPEPEKKRIIIKRLKKLQTFYKSPKWDDLSEIFDIEYLNTDQKAREEFERRKTYTSYFNSKFKCEICYLPFKHSRLLDNHMLNHDKEAGEFSCEICKTYYVSKHKLHNHTAMHHHRVFKCKRCPVIIRSEYSALGHCDYHKGIKTVCDLCQQEFNWKALYYAHRASVHGCKFICYICAFAFTTENKLEEHLKIHQKNRVIKPIGPDNPGFECDHCGHAFISKKICERHIKKTHTDKSRSWLFIPSSHQYKIDLDNDEPVMCEHCGTLFATARGLRLHIISHKKRITRPHKEVQCRVCGITFTRRHDLNLHFEEVHPDLDIEVVYADLKPFICDNCGKRFRYLCLLRDHILTHSDVKPFACTECPNRYYTQTQLLKHVIYHLPKSKECDDCGKLFRTAANLFSHKRSHIQNREFKCKYCGKGFLHRASVKEHERGVHHGIRRIKKLRIKKTYTENENENEPGKDGLDIDNVAIAAEYEITETENESTAEGYVDAEAGDEIIAARDEVTVTTRVLCIKRANDENLKVYAATSKRVRQESSSATECETE